MSELVLADSEQKQTRTSKLAKGERKKNGTLSSSAIAAETFVTIEQIDEKISSGFSYNVLLAIASKTKDFQNIATESAQIEYALKIAQEQSMQEGKRIGAHKAEQEIKAKRAEVLRDKADEFMEKFDDMFEGLLKLFGHDFAKALKHIKEATENFYINIEIKQVGDDYSYEWDYKPEIAEVYAQRS